MKSVICAAALMGQDANTSATERSMHLMRSSPWCRQYTPRWTAVRTRVLEVIEQEVVLPVGEHEAPEFLVPVLDHETSFFGVYQRATCTYAPESPSALPQAS